MYIISSFSLSLHNYIPITPPSSIHALDIITIKTWLCTSTTTPPHLRVPPQVHQESRLREEEPIKLPTGDEAAQEVPQEAVL